MTLKFWKERCIGDFNVIPINGNHVTCVESEEYGREVADILLKGIKED